jgi:hypothetical protein
MTTATKDIRSEPLTTFEKFKLRMSPPSKKIDRAKQVGIGLEEQEILLEATSYKVRDMLLKNPSLHPKIQEGFFDDFSRRATDFIYGRERDWSGISMLAISVTYMQKIAENQNITSGLPEKMKTRALELDKAVKFVIEDSNPLTRGLIIPALNHLLVELPLIGSNLDSNPTVKSNLPRAKSAASFSLR